MESNKLPGLGEQAVQQQFFPGKRLHSCHNSKTSISKENPQELWELYNFFASKEIPEETTLKPVHRNSDRNHTGDERSSVILKELLWPPKNVLFAMEAYRAEHDTIEVDKRSPTKRNLFLSEKPSTKNEAILETESKLTKETYSKGVHSKQFSLMANQRASSISGLYVNYKDEENEIHSIQQQRTPEQWRCEISLTLEELDNAYKTVPNYVEATEAYYSQKQSFSSKNVENDVCLPKANVNFTNGHQQLTHHDVWNFSSSVGANKDASSAASMEMKKTRETKDLSMNCFFDDAEKIKKELEILDPEKTKDCRYTCSECGHSFDRLNPLITHKRTHTGKMMTRTLGGGPFERGGV